MGLLEHDFWNQENKAGDGNAIKNHRGERWEMADLALLPWKQLGTITGVKGESMEAERNGLRLKTKAEIEGRKMSKMAWSGKEEGFLHPSVWARVYS